MDATQHVLTATLRSNPRYELVAFDRLSPSEQALLGPLTADADFHGVLRPRGNDRTLPIKAVSHDTARLLTALREPDTLPAFARGDPSESGPKLQSLAGLVLDGVLEVEHDGAFVTGPAAAPLLIARCAQSPTTTATARLSRAALQYASALRVDDPLALSARMYFYNRTPVAPHWRRRYLDPTTIASQLGVDENERAVLRPGGWERSTRAGAEREGWFLWRQRERTGQAGTPRTTPTYKLYVSPRHESLRDVVNVTLPLLARSAATAFKVGSTEQQLCRPDKLVAYFVSRAALGETAAALAAQLRGAVPQGVPFTAAIAADGLLSWGVDPPPAPQVMWREHESWRLWVTNRLAIALLTARRMPAADMTPWEFAVMRLELDGVDTTSWAPSDTSPSARNDGGADRNDNAVARPDSGAHHADH